MISPEDEPATLFEPATGEPVEREISLEGHGQPYILDAWSGKITPIVNYTTSGDRIGFRIRLSRDNGMLIAISYDPRRFGIAPPAAHVTKTTADDASLNGRAIVIRASKAGSYSTTLSDGRNVTSNIEDVPAPINLTSATWHLAIEDWQPVHPYATTVGVAAAETRKDRIELDVTGLKPWPQIRELRNVSGLGTYTASFDLPVDWDTVGKGARLDLGEVLDSFVMAINGHAVYIDQISAQGDIGPYLKPGLNTIAVRCHHVE